MTNEHFHKNFEKVGSKLKNRISKNKQVRSEYRNWRKTYEKHVKHEENKKRENYQKMWRRTHKRTHSEHANEKQRKMCKKTSTDTGVIWNMLHNYGRNLEKCKDIKKTPTKLLWVRWENLKNAKTYKSNIPQKPGKTQWKRPQKNFTQITTFLFWANAFLWCGNLSLFTNEINVKTESR